MSDVLDLLESPGQSIIITPGTEPLDRDDWFERVCECYPDAKVEMDEDGNVVVTPGNSEDSGYRSAATITQLYVWAEQDGTGFAFDATTLFNLPSGAKRSPEAAWVAKETLWKEGENTRRATKTRHAPVYLIEVMSPSASLKQQQEKCRTWIEAGVKEAVLLDPKTKTAYVFLPSSMREVADAGDLPSTVLSGFVLNCLKVWKELK